MVLPLGGGRGVKPPLITKQKNHFFLSFEKKWPGPHETQENEYVMLVLVNIDQQEKVINNLSISINKYLKMLNSQKTWRNFLNQNIQPEPIKKQVILHEL